MMTGLQHIQRAALNAPPRAVRHPRQRPGPQQGEVRVRCLGAGYPGPPHHRRQRHAPPGQCPDRSTERQRKVDFIISDNYFRTKEKFFKLLSCASYSCKKK